MVYAKGRARRPRGRWRHRSGSWLQSRRSVVAGPSIQHRLLQLELAQHDVDGIAADGAPEREALAVERFVVQPTGEIRLLLAPNGESHPLRAGVDTNRVSLTREPAVAHREHGVRHRRAPAKGSVLTREIDVLPPRGIAEERQLDAVSLVRFHLEQARQRMAGEPEAAILAGLAIGDHERNVDDRCELEPQSASPRSDTPFGGHARSRTVQEIHIAHPANIGNEEE